MCTARTGGPWPRSPPPPGDRGSRGEVLTARRRPPRPGRGSVPCAPSGSGVPYAPGRAGPLRTSSRASSPSAPSRKRVRAYAPCSSAPRSRKEACPRSRDSAKSTGCPPRSWFSDSYVPRSHTITVPPPYRPLGGTPSNSSYSSGTRTSGRPRPGAGRRSACGGRRGSAPRSGARHRRPRCRPPGPRFAGPLSVTPRPVLRRHPRLLPYVGFTPFGCPADAAPARGAAAGGSRCGDRGVTLSGTGTGRASERV